MTIYFEDLQKDFLKRSKKISNTKHFLENELKQIDIFLNHKAYEVRSDYLIGGNDYQSEIKIIDSVYYNVRSAWSTFIKPYNEYYYNGTEMPYKPIESMLGNTKEEVDETNKRVKQYHIQGTEFAKYVLWLKELQSNPVKKSSENKFSDLNNDQKLLALHYLGLDLRDYTKKQAAYALGQILNIGNENIRKNLSVFQGGKNKLRTPENFDKLIELFENKTFESISNKLKREKKDL